MALMDCISLAYLRSSLSTTESGNFLIRRASITIREDCRNALRTFLSSARAFGAIGAFISQGTPSMSMSGVFLCSTSLFFKNTTSCPAFAKLLAVHNSCGRIPTSGGMVTLPTFSFTANHVPVIPYSSMKRTGPTMPSSRSTTATLGACPPRGRDALPGFTMRQDPRTSSRGMCVWPCTASPN